MTVPMTLTQARLIVQNYRAYHALSVRAAAIWLLASLDASDEDVHDAAAALDWARPKACLRGTVRTRVRSEIDTNG